MATENKAFHEAVTCVLSCALQPDSEIQRLAEERKKALEMVDEYPFTLMEIIGSSEEALAEKHMASIFLKNYFHDIFTGKRDNQILRNPLALCRLTLGLIELLRLNFVSIKTMISKTLSYIVYKGFWGIIDHRIFPMLKSDNEDHVYNAVFFLKQCMNYDEYRSALPFKASPEYFEILLTIFQKNIPSEFRYLTIQPMFYIISHCLSSEVQENALSRLGVEFFNALNEPYNINSDFKFKSEIINYISKFEVLGPTKHCYIITNALPAIGQLMISCCDQFKEIIRETSNIPKDSTEDHDDDSTNFIDLINLIMDLIKDMVYSMYFDLLLEDLDNLLYCLFTFICCYDNMEEELFLEDEDKTRHFPIRSKAVNILLHIRYRVSNSRRKGPDIFYKSVHTVFHKLMQDVQLITSNRQLFHTRVTESMMFGLGYMNCSSEIDGVFPHNFYIDNWTTQMQQEPNPTVNGRLLWLGGTFSSLLSPNTMSIHLKAIVENLQGNSAYLYVPSTEAIKDHLMSYDDETMPVENRYILKSLSKELFECLLSMIQKLNNPTSAFRALGIFIKHHDQCAYAYIHTMQETLINAIYNHVSNTDIMREVNILLSKLATKDRLQEALHHTMVPFLCKILQGDLPEQLKDHKDAPEKALELLNTIATYTTRPLCEAMIMQGFTGTANLLLDSEQDLDCNVIEAGLNFITTLIVKMGAQINYLRNSKEVRLTEFIPKIIFECMDSPKPISGMQIGKLVIVSIMTVPDVMEPQFESILKSVLSSIQMDCSFNNLRGLWLVFIQIFMCRPGNTINFLSSIPGPNGGSALNFIINMWLPDFVGLMSRYERTVMSMSLIRVISYVLEGNGDRLKEVEVQLGCLGRNTGKISGVEYFYLILIFIVLMEHSLNEEIANPYFDGGLEEEYLNEDGEILKKFTPLNIDIVPVVTQFLKHENAYYLNVCRNYLYHEEIVRLSNMGCTVPQVSME